MSAEKKSKHRLIIIFMAVLGAVLTVRLLTLTVFQYDKWESYAEDMSMRAVYETAPRGDIVDRNGKIIATSRAVYSVTISRIDIDKNKALEAAADIMGYLEASGEDVSVTQQKVRETIEDTGYMSYMPITLAEDISAEAASEIQRREYPGVSISKNYVREYPNGAFASHIIGYLGMISDNDEEYISEKGYRKDALIGKSGIEALCEEKLRGTDAVSMLQVNSLGNVTKLLNKTEPQQGETVRLTLDSRLQEVTEDALSQAVRQASRGGTFTSSYGDVQMTYAPKAASGAAVAIDVKTGQVLAMASFPDFDPNDFVDGISSSKWQSLQQENPNDPLSPAPLYNIATMSAVQPGSTFKPVTALAALDSGVDENEKIYDKGHVKAGDRTFGCYLWNDNKSTHGYIDLCDAMKVSCNYYFYKAAQKSGSGQILSFARKLGLGEKTGIETGESSGVLPSKKQKIQASEANLRSLLRNECETYFKKSALKDNGSFEKNIEKIIKWSYKDLTLDELIGKLKQEDFIRENKVEELAGICKYMYADSSGWTVGDTFNVSIGQGDNAYTPVQMARYMAALGNGGIRNDVTLLYDEDAAGSGTDGISDINQADIDVVIDAMTAVTTEPGGSLYGTFAAFPYKTAAKTGTAQRAGKINTKNEKDYLRRHLHLIAPDVSFIQVETEADRLMEEYPDIYTSETAALRRAVITLSDRNITTGDIDSYKEDYDNFAWTVALAPADDPQIAVAVMLVQGRTASNAAPVAREIIGKYGEISRWEKLF